MDRTAHSLVHCDPDVVGTTTQCDAVVRLSLSCIDHPGRSISTLLELA
jgi:hypothetical protein